MDINRGLALIKKPSFSQSEQRAQDLKNFFGSLDLKTKARSLASAESSNDLYKVPSKLITKEEIRETQATIKSLSKKSQTDLKPFAEEYFRQQGYGQTEVSKIIGRYSGPSKEAKKLRKELSSIQYITYVIAGYEFPTREEFIQKARIAAISSSKDLSKLYLSNEDFSKEQLAGIPGVDLTLSIFKDVTLPKDLDMNFARAQGLELHHTYLNGAKLRGADLEGATIDKHSSLEAADMNELSFEEFCGLHGTRGLAIEPQKLQELRGKPIKLPRIEISLDEPNLRFIDLKGIFRVLGIANEARVDKHELTIHCKAMGEEKFKQELKQPITFDKLSISQFSPVPGMDSSDFGEYNIEIDPSKIQLPKDFKDHKGISYDPETKILTLDNYVIPGRVTSPLGDNLDPESVLQVLADRSKEFKRQYDRFYNEIKIPTLMSKATVADVVAERLLAAGLDTRGSKFVNFDASKSQMSSAIFDKAEFHHSSFEESDLRGSSFVGSEANTVSFERSSLGASNSLGDPSFPDRSRFDKAKFKQVVFNGADMQGASMHGAEMTNAQFKRSHANRKKGWEEDKDTNLSSAVASMAQLKHPRFEFTDLSRLHFRDCEISHAKFFDPNMTNSNWDSSIFFNTRFSQLRPEKFKGSSFKEYAAFCKVQTPGLPSIQQFLLNSGTQNNEHHINNTTIFADTIKDYNRQVEQIRRGFTN